MERKCTNCGTWNQQNDFCVQCDTPISPKEVQKIQVDNRAKIINKRPKSKLDLFIEKVKNSTNPFVIILYKTVSFVWFIYMAILSFFLWFIALGPG